jgi:hypothetical protein
MPMVSPTQRSWGASSSSSGNAAPSTSGRFATLSPRCASISESGVLEVRETPTRTMSALRKFRGSLPSSLFTANSTDSMRRKYSSQREHRARQVDGLSIEEGAELADERADDVDRLDRQLRRHLVDELA